MRKQADWLMGELADLVAAGVLDATAAERLRAHYAGAAGSRGPDWSTVLLALGGAALVGLGVILLFAHNWENWTPGVRVTLSLLPLLAGQLACAQALRNGSRVWAEAAGAFTALMIGASIALIAQTYQFGGDLPRFLLTWTLLALPLVYLLDASAVAALCWIGALGWVSVSHEFGWWREATLADTLRLPAFLLLAALPLPHLMRHLRADRGSARVNWLLRVALLMLALGVAEALEWRNAHALYFVYASMAACSALAGRVYFSGRHGLWGNPLLGAGRTGVFVIALLATLHTTWSEAREPLANLLLLPAALGVLAAWLGWRAARDGARALGLALAAFTPLLFALDALAASQPGAAQLISNLYVLALAAVLIRTGLREAQLGDANQGAALIAALVLMRFFDSDLSYLVRGIGFIVTGAGFFAANLWLRRRLRSAA